MTNPARVLLCGAVLLGVASRARAEAPTAPENEPAPNGGTVPTERAIVGPNAILLASGFVTLGVPYATSIIVASQSTHDGDKSLYVPVAGPFLDLANRGSCDGIGEATCATETGYKVLLIADGLLQTVGVVELMTAVLIPERRTVVASRMRAMVLGPTRLGRAGYGVTAMTTF
jgi:hypothetical protein